MPVTVLGTVVSGKKIGHTIGFPTANVLPQKGQIWPARGVYAGDIRINGDGAFMRCVVNCGLQPTIPSGHKTIEVHILDFTDDIYGAKVELILLRFIRDEQKFGSIDALREQLSRDVASAR